MNKRQGTDFYKDQRSEADQLRDLLNQFATAKQPADIKSARLTAKMQKRLPAA